MQGNENNHTLLMGVPTTTHVRAQSLSCVSFFETHGLWPARLLRPWDSPGRVPEWVAIFFSRASSRARDRTLVSYIGRQILYHWATRGGHKNWQKPLSKSVWQCFLKLNPTTQQFHFWVYTKRNEYLGWTKKIMHRRVHNSIAHNSQKTGNNPNVPQWVNE